MKTCRAAAAAPSAVAIEAGDGARLLRCACCCTARRTWLRARWPFAAVSAIVANALLLQAGRHPAPMFGSVVTLPAPHWRRPSPLPRPRPVEADALVKPEPELQPARSKAAEPRAAEPKRPMPRRPIRMANLVKATSAPPLQLRQCRCGRRRRSRPPAQTARLAPCRGGAARADRIWLWPVEADRHHRRRHPGRDPEIRARRARSR